MNIRISFVLLRNYIIMQNIDIKKKKRVLTHFGDDTGWWFYE